MSELSEKSAQGAAPDISVIVVNWNAGRYLSEFLRTLREDTAGFSTEILVVDNGSTDGSVEWLTTENPDVTVISAGRNLGFAGANNIGIRQSTGRYLCLVNPDVKILPGCFRTLVKYMEEHPETGVSGPKVRGGDDSLQQTCRPFPSIPGALARAFALDRVFFTYRSFDTPGEVDVMNGCFWLVRREAFDDVGFLDERFFMYSEDIDWCRRFRDAGWKVVCNPAAEIIHYGGGSSSLAPTRFYLEMRRANLQYWRKHYPPAASSIFVMISVFHQVLRYLGYSASLLLSHGDPKRARFKRSRSLLTLRWLLLSSRRTDEPIHPSFYDERQLKRRSWHVLKR